MSVDAAATPHRAEHLNETYFFCCAGCRARFLADPERYLRRTETPARTFAAPEAQRRENSTYTCPMHPEVRQPAAGSCPLCGMALEPTMPELAQEPSAELSSMRRRFWVAAALAAVVVAAAIAGHALGGSFAPFGGARFWEWAQFAFATPAVLFAGWPLLLRGWSSLQHRSLNMFSLICLGIGATFLESTFALLAPQLFPPSARQAGGTVPVYFESAAIITALVLLGQVLELRARASTGTALRALLTLAPASATRISEEGRDETIALDEVRVGDRLRIKPAERIPVDGLVLDGHSGADESMMTGEPIPAEKLPGSSVLGGTLNGSGTLVIRAEKVGSQTLLARIVRSVAEAQRSRAPVQTLADAVSAWFVPAVIVAAIAACVAWLIFGPSPAAAYALTAAVSVLIIACPCALGLAVPMSIMVGVGRGAAAGILVRNAEALERLEQVDTLVVDKTGTLTQGKPRVSGVIAAEGHEEDTVLSFAGSLERSSEHPLAAAILAASRERNLEPRQVADFRSLPGRGIGGSVDGHRVVLGSEGWLHALGIATKPLAAAADRARREGGTAVFLGLDGSLAGLIIVADPIRPSTPQALEQLRATGLRIVMLTGDHRLSAEAVARRLGISETTAELLPEQKQHLVQALREQGHIVAMTGDGVNDAPALAAADVGLAMGTGTDVALQTAGVALVRGELAGVVRARTLSRVTMRNIRQNLFLAFIYNALGIPIAAGALYPAFGLLLSPIIAAAAMSLSSLSVIANSLRLRHAEL